MQKSYEEQDELIMQLESVDILGAAPAGAKLIGMYILEYVGFPKYVIEILEKDTC